MFLDYVVHLNLNECINIKTKSGASDSVMRGSHSHDCTGDHRRPKQSPVVAWKSPVKSAKIEFYNRSTTESTTTYVDTRPSYDIVVRRL